jgi:hypothetical protein
MRSSSRFGNDVDTDALGRGSIELQCCTAFLQAKKELINYAVENRHPLYEWEVLTSLSKDELVAYVGNEALATCLIESRTAPSTDRLSHMEQWSDALHEAERLFGC